MAGFRSALYELITQASPKAIHEVGCGEGYWVIQLHLQGFDVKGSDFSASVIEMARHNAKAFGIAKDRFLTCSIYDLDEHRHGADLLLCLDVLEHLLDPEAALRALLRACYKYLIVSVPNEPLWSFLNMVRGKYLRDKGNTPGHIQRWSQKAFIDFVSNHFQVIAVRSPLPWTMLLCQPPK
ncbi:class I SAM-dependent methyltransferase [Desulfacinum infernum]